MSHIQATVSFENVTALPRDRVVNTFHFDGTPGADVDSLAITAALFNFYNLTTTSGNALANFMSTTISRSTPFQAELYDMTQPKPRVPYFAATASLGAATSNTSLPSEVALVSSFQAQYVSGISRARRRGRVYIGPLSSNAGANPTNAANRPAVAFIQTLNLASKRLCVNAAADGVPWQVYSRINNSIAPVIAGWVDNDFDTQRRRSAAATTRDPWTTAV